MNFDFFYENFRSVEFWDGLGFFGGNPPKIMQPQFTLDLISSGKNKLKIPQIFPKIITTIIILFNMFIVIFIFFGRFN